MGRATIVSGGANGRYTIDLDYGAALRDAAVAKLNTRIADLEDRANWQQGQIDGFQGGLDSLRPEFDALLSEYVAMSNAAPRDADAIKAKRTQIDKKTADIIKQQAWLASAQADLAVTNTSIKSAQLERGALLAAEVAETRQAWCADLTEHATGQVATLEVPGESALILIQPGAPAPTAIHGALTAREVMSPAQAFWNAAVLPGWQKHKPTYRAGTISAINTVSDTCSVSLLPALSSAQKLDINQATVLRNVPVRYMDCNARAFRSGDLVVVEFAGNDWSSPSVIGFIDTPRSCADAPPGGGSGDRPVYVEPPYQLPEDTRIFRLAGIGFEAAAEHSQGPGSGLNPPYNVFFVTVDGPLNSTSTVGRSAVGVVPESGALYFGTYQEYTLIYPPYTGRISSEAVTGEEGYNALGNRFYSLAMHENDPEDNGPIHVKHYTLTGGGLTYTTDWSLWQAAKPLLQNVVAYNTANFAARQAEIDAYNLAYAAAVEQAQAEYAAALAEWEANNP